MSSGCGDVLSLEDLKTAKKHQLFEAEVITGLEGGVASGAHIDYATNTATGQVQKTMPAILRDIGFRPATFDFDSGGTIGVNDRDLAVLWPLPGGDGDWYYWEGALPKVIPASSTPNSTGGIADGAWRPVGDITLRGALASSTGASMIGYDATTVAAELIKLNRRAEFVTPEEYGAIGDGVTDDTTAWNNAVATGKDVHAKPGAVYKISSSIILPYGARPQNIFGNNATISSTGIFITFRQRLADNSVVDNTSLKNFFEVVAQGIASEKSIYSAVSGLQFLRISNGMAVNCTARGFCDSLSAMGNARVFNFTADNIRNAAVRGEGNNNIVVGVKVGWAAGDVILIKSNYSYYANLYCKYAGIAPTDSQEPSSLMDQGAMVTFAQDGVNATYNTVENVTCSYYGAGFAVFSGSYNKVTGYCYGGVWSEATRAKGFANAIYMAGTRNSIGNVLFDLVGTGVEMHGGSDNCFIGRITILQKSGYGVYCLSTNGTTTNCYIDGLHVHRGAQKTNDLYLASDGTDIGEIIIDKVTGPVSGGSPGWVGAACRIRRLEFNSSTTTASGLVNVTIGASVTIGELSISNCLGSSLIVNDNIIPVIDRILIKPRPTATSRPINMVSSNGAAVRYVGAITINPAPAAPRLNGELSIGYYLGPAWQKDNASVSAAVKYPEPVNHVI